MPTLYNGKEITSTSKLSGLSLVGRPSITIGGKVTTLSTDPPSTPTIDLYGDGVSWNSPEEACGFGPSGGRSTRAYIFSNRGKYFIFQDDTLSIPFPDGFFWTNDTTNIGGGPGSYWVEIIGGQGIPNFDVC